MPESGRCEEVLGGLRADSDYFESHWSLPWVDEHRPPRIWEDPRLAHVESLEPNLRAEVLGHLIEDRSYALRGLGIWLASRQQHPKLWSRIEARVNDPSEHVRALAVHAIGSRAGDGWIELLEVRDSEEAEVKKAVVDALRLQRDVRAIPLLARWVGRTGEDDELRKKACEALAWIGDDAAFPVLARVLADDTVADDIRGEAARALGLIGGNEAQQLLIETMGQARPHLQAACARALGDAGDRGHVPLLAPLLETSRPAEVRSKASIAIALLGGASALGPLEALCSDSDPALRGASCEALAIIGTMRARQRLRALLDDPVFAVQVQALGAYQSLTPDDLGLPAKTGLEDDLEHWRAALERARAHAENPRPGA